MIWAVPSTGSHNRTSRRRRARAARLSAASGSICSTRRAAARPSSPGVIARRCASAATCSSTRRCCSGSSTRVVSITRPSPPMLTRPVPTRPSSRGCWCTAADASRNRPSAVIVATPSALATSTGALRPASSARSPSAWSSATRRAANASRSRSCDACTAWTSRSLAAIRSSSPAAPSVVGACGLIRVRGLVEHRREGRPVATGHLRQHLHECSEHVFYSTRNPLLVAGAFPKQG